MPIPNSLALGALPDSDLVRRATVLTIGIERVGRMRALVIRPGRQVAAAWGPILGAAPPGAGGG